MGLVHFGVRPAAHVGPADRRLDRKQLDDGVQVGRPVDEPRGLQGAVLVGDEIVEDGVHDMAPPPAPRAGRAAGIAVAKAATFVTDQAGGR